MIAPGLGNLYGQLPRPATPDSVGILREQTGNGYDLLNLQFSTKEYTQDHSNFLSDFKGYTYQFAKGLSIQAGNYPRYQSFGAGRNVQNGIMSDSAGGIINGAYYQRPNFRLQGLRLDVQHFSFGASYNYGLNNFWKSGGDFSSGAKNAGLSIHAGLRF